MNTWNPISKGGITLSFKDMIYSAFPSSGNKPLAPLATDFGTGLDSEHILPEYPRPQLKRRHFHNLNGYWQYAITDTPKRPQHFDGSILVPFSPESSLSGVHRQLKPAEYLWYERRLELDHIPKGRRCILHFEAVDQCAIVCLNGHRVCRHVGGYLPFETDITRWLKIGTNVLTVRVQDFSDASYHSRGKQRRKRSGMFYTAQSGIWQTVWYEWVPERYITNLHISTDYDHDQVTIRVETNISGTAPAVATLSDEVPAVTKIGLADTDITFTLTNKKSWSPDSPYLYPFTVALGDDQVSSYFAMRHFAIEKDADGTSKICINHHPCFLNGVLDQGYWPDGLMTAPSDDALIDDIRQMKRMGFNMLRKHIKIESRRWYYHCDRLGMVVWQDMVNGGNAYSKLLLTYMPTLLPGFRFPFNSFGFLKKAAYRMQARQDIRGRREWLSECIQTIRLLEFFPAIMTWVPFNEGWGQFDTVAVTRQIQDADPTRLVDHASGWFDHGEGDFKSVHNYFHPMKVTPDRHQRCYILSEYGGYACRVEEHACLNEIYGYKKYETTRAFDQAFLHLMSDTIPTMIHQGLCAAVYTQLSDVEEEVNGLLTYDRKVCKLSTETIDKLHDLYNKETL